MCAASLSPMSIPEETPAAVITLPCSTTRRLVGRAPNWRSVSSSSQCVVASNPSRMPAAPRSSDPVQPDVVHSELSCARRSHPSTVSSVSRARVPNPPGTTITSGRATSSSECSATITNDSVSVRFGPGSTATNRTAAPGNRERTSYGPTASSAVKRSYRKTAISMAMSLRSGRVAQPGSEVASVVARAHAEAARERASKRLDGPEAALAGDLVHLGVAALERDPRALEPHRLDVGGRREADLPLKDAGEVARAHERAFGEDGHREILVEVTGDPALKLAQRLAPRRLACELGAELRLTAGPLEEEHQPPRHLERDLRPQVVLDERERQV